MAGEQQENVYIFQHVGQSGDKIVPLDLVKEYCFFPNSSIRHMVGTWCLA